MAVDKDGFVAYRESPCTIICILTRFLSILFLNILSLSSDDDLLRSLIVLWENEHFLMSNRLCSLSNVKLYPLVLVRAMISIEKGA